MGKQYFIAPADIEPSVLASVTNGQIDWELLPPDATRVIPPEVEGGKAHKETYNPRVELLDALNPGDQIFAPLGGVGDAFLIGAYQRGAVIHRIPFFELQRQPRGDIVVPASLTGRTVDSSDKAAVKKRAALAERCQWAAQMIFLAGQPDTRDLFRDFREVDLRIAVIRVLIATMIAVQDEVRKRLEQRTMRLERDRAYIIAPGTPSAVAMDLRVGLIESGPTVDALKKFEHELAKDILRELRRLRIYTEVLEPVRGIGPRLGARLIAPIVDIRRFPTIGGFTKYAGWHVLPANGHRIAAKFQRGASAQFHPLSRMGFWLFAEQLVRSNSEFRWYYDRYKASARAERIGEVVYVDDKGKEHKLTKAWFERRARRYAASKLLHYLFYGWWGIEGRTFTSARGEVIDPARFLNPETLPYSY